MQYDVEDQGLAYLDQCIKKGEYPTLVNFGVSSVVAKQTFYVQWETIQSIESGIVFLLGMYKTSKNTEFDILDANIMKSISTMSLWRWETDNSVYDYIVELHAKSGIVISPEQITKIKTIVDAGIANDSQGLIFQISPCMAFLNALINLHLDKMTTKIIFVVDKSLCPKALHAPNDVLIPFFIHDIEHPIYIDYRENSFAEYIINKPQILLDESGIVTFDKSLLEASVTDSHLFNMTFLIPETPRFGFNISYIDLLSLRRATNEYIGYIQKVLHIPEKVSAVQPAQ